MSVTDRNVAGGKGHRRRINRWRPSRSRRQRHEASQATHQRKFVGVPMLYSISIYIPSVLPEQFNDPGWSRHTVTQALLLSSQVSLRPFDAVFLRKAPFQSSFCCLQLFILPDANLLCSRLCTSTFGFNEKRHAHRAFHRILFVAHVLWFALRTRTRHLFPFITCITRIYIP